MIEVPKNTARFFMPGHKGRGQLNISEDVTELDGIEEVIKDEQEKAAKVFGSRETFFLVNGSTIGVHAMLGTACRPGDKVIITAGCHVSVINAAVIFDLRPVFVYPKYNSLYDIYEALTPNQLEQALSKNIDAKAVLVTSPTYFGVCADIAGLKKVTKKYGIPLLVDEAHGAHLSFSDSLPPSAMQSGADACVQSAHKTLPCLTQTAYLHNNTLDAGRINETIKTLQSSSPSYLFMKSLAKGYSFDKDKLERIIEECRTMPSFSDPTRLVFNFGKNVPKVKKHLAENGIIVEMATSCCIVAIATVNNTIGELKKLKRETSKFEPDIEEHSAPHEIVMAMPPRQAYFSACYKAFGRDAVGKVAARTVFKTPPAIPKVPVGAVIPEEIEEEVWIVCES